PHGLQILVTLATDLRRPGLVRRAATLGLGLAEAADGSALVPLLDVPDSERAQAAAAALGAIKDRRTLPAPWERALLGRGPGDRLRDRVAALLDDGDPAVRRLAVRVASKLRDPRVGLSHVHAMAAAPAEGEAAALLAARALLESGRIPAASLVESLRDLLADS